MAHVSARIPKYRRHRGSGQAFVQIQGKRHYLGRHGTAKSREKYHRILAEFSASPAAIIDGAVSGGATNGITVKEIAAAYWIYCEGYYRSADGHGTGELSSIRQALRFVRKNYASLPAAEFGPKALKACRQAMIEADWSRGHINRQIDRVRRMFRWATEAELVPLSLYHGLKAVAGLRAGRSDARETEPVKPVPMAFVEATLPKLTPQLRAAVRLQLLTGCRPGEVLAIRGCNLDTSGRIWVYRPAAHKTACRGHIRTIYLGPKSQALVREFLKLDTAAFLFSPRDAKETLWAERRANRKTPMTPSQAKRRRKAKPKREPGESYSVKAYGRAIRKACIKADVPHWHPHQLRHTRATELRKEFGIETARIILGHKSALITETYAELDHARAIEVMGNIG